MIKKISLSITSTFLVWQSYDLLRNIEKFQSDSLLAILFVAWVINMFITGIFAFSGFAFSTQKLLPKTYYYISNPKRLKKIFDLLKVNKFRMLLLATLWKSQKQRKKYFNGKMEGIQNLETQSMKSEFGHLIPFIIINSIGIYLITIGSFILGVFTFLLNFIGNYYPIILQRHHRMRIQLIRERKQRNVHPI